MSRTVLRRLVYGALLLVYLLHNDFWLETDGLVLGLPISLGYHLLLCVAAAAVFWALIHAAWPQEPEAEDAPGSA